MSQPTEVKSIKRVADPDCHRGQVFDAGTQAGAGASVAESEDQFEQGRGPSEQKATTVPHGSTTML